MVCSHCPTLRSINRPIRNGLHRISGGVHTAQIQTLTQTSIGLCVNLLPSANEVAESYVFTPVCHSVHRRGSASGSGSVNTPLPPTHTPTPLDTPSPGHTPTQSTSGRYASYWNAFLLVSVSVSVSVSQCKRTITGNTKSL